MQLSRLTMLAGGAVYVKDAGFESRHARFSQNAGTETAGEALLEYYNTKSQQVSCILSVRYRY